MDVIALARQAKHRLWVLRKRWRRARRRVPLHLATAFGPLWSRLHPYRFDPNRYLGERTKRWPHDFLAEEVTSRGDQEGALPRRVFVVWTGTNELTPNRARNLRALRDVIGVPVEFITPKNLRDWVVDDHPLHPAYKNLSLVHQSDYLRAYLLHHYGGGYCDLKRPLASWAPVFEAMRSRPDVWLTSFSERNAFDPARLSGRLGFDVSMNYTRLVGCSAMICRSGTAFTREWLSEVERRLDVLEPELALHPGGIRNEAAGYPVSWTDLLGKVYHPLQLKHLDRVQADDRLLLEFHDYQ
ncbi:hypothetical protein M3G03_01620 [Aestuariimicrobium sp. p3-SID1156]|uniref:glycosyltransferase n=1 Tax=Aestuariimicrobium sp. p3-SID1156 TaxID=2916038 RepID=UPI00223B32B3|nr:glycosyltransferase [Aestuariimicrobium sp. p3-SID1156]MCT1458252.1 hypothetical protein [Aestuariimicrobium sp. p3-SID1156]